jgi:signal transduction histidine kinase
VSTTAAVSGRSSLLLWAGLVAYGVAGLPRALTWAQGRAPFDAMSVVWCMAYLAFGLSFIAASASERWKRRRPLLLGAQTLAALVFLSLSKNGFEGILFCVVAGEAPLLVGEKRALTWVATQVALMVVVDLFHGTSRADVFSAIAFAGFQLFAFGASRIAVREAAGREELGRVHAELLAKEALLADSARVAERLRIARELHDALGHHLTALCLQLELARNVADGRAKDPVDRAHGLTKELLAELRTVVGTMRDETPIDLSRALHTLVAGIPEPRVHLDIKGPLDVDAPLAHTIFRCVQEALTNAVRHARAANVYLEVQLDTENVTVRARDDGRGALVMKPGHGLSGLRERIEGMGGTLEVVAALGAGLTLSASLPLRRRAA